LTHTADTWLAAFIEAISRGFRHARSHGGRSATWSLARVVRKWRI